jgi:hypothetical protein
MTIEQHKITSREQWLDLRRNDVTASTIGALFGVHEYQTAFGLHALKTGRVAEDPEQTPAMERGTLLEPVAAELLRRRNPTWIVKHPVGFYYRDPEMRLGATPDCLVNDPERGLGVVQFKSVEGSVFARKWRREEDGVRVVEPPLWIALQAMAEQYLCPGACWAAVGALVVGHGLDLHLVDVPMHDGVMARTKTEVAAFWRAIDEGRTPDIDFAKDGPLLEDLFEGGGPMADLSGSNALLDLADEKERLVAERGSAEKRLKEIKAEFLAALGDAGAARLADGRVVTAKRIYRKAYSVAETDWVDLRVKKTW